LKEATKYYKLSADQNHADGQFNDVFCLKCKKGVSIDLNEAAQHYKLSADQVHADGQCHDRFCLESAKMFRLI
jgi:TPR repeat protein